MKNHDFEAVSSSQISKENFNEYELIEYGKIRNESAPIGDFLSRMWENFGKPERTMFEGFDYYIKDKKSKIIFIAYFGASGPSYATKNENIEKMKLRIKDFEILLDNSKNADCEIEVENDYGIFLCGSKNGIAYDKEK